MNKIKKIQIELSTYVEGGFDSRRGTPNTSGLTQMTPRSGGSLKIGRRSTERSKSPFRSFRWKRTPSRTLDSEYDEEGKRKTQQTQSLSLSLSLPIFYNS